MSLCSTFLLENIHCVSSPHFSLADSGSWFLVAVSRNLNQSLSFSRRYLTATCTDSLFNKFMENIIHELSTNSDPSVTRTYIQCIGTTSRHSGHRVGNHLDKLMPLLTGFCMRADEHGDEHGDELREYCIQAFEGLVRRCPKEITGE